ncbi:hypothetical protein LY78DRAFT_655963 [Colletotrichum sublineola]|nr:hypothetical protein LY78DRAFT_655963 [Colletotrichum sublineola]
MEKGHRCIWGAICCFPFVLTLTSLYGWLGKRFGLLGSDIFKGTGFFSRSQSMRILSISYIVIVQSGYHRRDGPACRVIRIVRQE